MNAQQKAVIDKAAKEGKLPSEITGEFLLHDLVQACIGQLSKHEVGFRKLTEKQQDAAIAELTDNLKESALLAARIIASAGTPTVSGTLKKIAIDAKSVLTVSVDGGEKYFNELISKTQDKSDVLIVLYERDYFDALDNIQSEKDQKSLPLDGDKPAKKAPAKGKTKAAADVAASIALEPAMMEKASKFITDVRTPTIAGIQNVLGIGFQKAEAVLAELARKGEIVAEEDGSYSMPKAIKTLVDPVDDQDGPAIHAELTEDLYQSIKAGVIEKQSVAKIAITIKHGVTDEVADDAIDRLEMEGVISAEDEMGGREVLEQAA
jgi:ribosomal protein S25